MVGLIKTPSGSYNKEVLASKTTVCFKGNINVASSSLTGKDDDSFLSHNRDEAANLIATSLHHGGTDGLLLYDTEPIGCGMWTADITLTTAGHTISPMEISVIALIDIVNALLDGVHQGEVDDIVYDATYELTDNDDVSINSGTFLPINDCYKLFKAGKIPDSMLKSYFTVIDDNTEVRDFIAECVYDSKKT